MASSVGGYQKGGKWEAWTPQSIVCGTQVEIGGNSLGGFSGTEKWVGRQEKKQKERILEGSKENMIPSSYTTSQYRGVGPNERDTSGTLWQATNQDSEAQ